MWYTANHFTSGIPQEGPSMDETGEISCFPQVGKMVDFHRQGSDISEAPIKGEK
jgi:hypothetical protein